MSIDTKRLAKDRAYWDEVAPEGATHIHAYSGGFFQWVKANLSGANNYYWHNRFSEWEEKEGPRYGSLIACPKEPEKWNDGLPPVGVECEVDDVDQGWISAIVIGYDDTEGVVVCKTPYGYDGYDGYSNFRPLRMPEQCECDEVVEAALSMDCRPSDGMLSRTDFCRALYDAGMLRRAEE